MTINTFPTDSAATPHQSATTPDHPYIYYPPYSAQYLGGLVGRLNDLSGGDVPGVLPSLNEPTLYALAAAATLSNLPTASEFLADSAVPLRDELRVRGCRGMGAEPAGPVRRGRLIQLVATFATLSVAGASLLQRHTLVGDCPFCGAQRFRLFLPSVRWRCFTCGREGALLEFAERLLETRSQIASENQRRSRDPVDLPL